MRVARLYHEQSVKQADIARELHLSTARVSRLLASAVEAGIVRTVVTPPDGTHLELEERLEERFGLREAIVVEPGEHDVVATLGGAAARHLEATLHSERGVAIATWSSTLISAVEQLGSMPGCSVDVVSQLVGGYGTPRVQAASYRMILRLATLTNADAVVVPAPGVLGSQEARDSLLGDPPVLEALDVARAATVALVGIGSMSPSRLIRESGNAMPADELESLRQQGAVGDVCLRFFDGDGAHVPSEFDRRIVGVVPDDLMRIPRRVGVAGGLDKVDAIRGALRGGWLTTLITDARVAAALVA